MTSSHGDHLETEQKYDVDAGFALPDPDGLAGLAGLRAAGVNRYQLSATYFDTDALDLHENKVTLRRRTGGSDEGWHLKLPVRKDTRQEVHAPLDEGAAGDVPARLAAQVGDITARDRLHPIAVLDTERTVVTLTGVGGEPVLEVADDRVTATRLGATDGQRLAWREIEVEVVSGDGPAAAGALERIGQGLRQAGARPSAEASKLSRLLQS
ncbi:MAG: CYTH domain-containing protein [Actinobacteria bacterium]|nr:CYTH domain-containing protein [Actinomycetota bacterium]